MTNSDLEIFIWLLETIASTSQCLQQIFFWKKTIKVSGQSPERPRTRDSETRKLSGPNRWLLKKTPGYQKGQYFGGILGGSRLPGLCKKDKAIMLHKSKSQLVKSVGLFCIVFHAKQNEEVTGLSVSLGQGETCPLRIKQFHCATALEQFWWCQKSEGTQ